MLLPTPCHCDGAARRGFAAICAPPENIGFPMVFKCFPIAAAGLVSRVPLSHCDGQARIGFNVSCQPSENVVFPMVCHGFLITVVGYCLLPTQNVDRPIVTHESIGFPMVFQGLSMHFTVRTGEEGLNVFCPPLENVVSPMVFDGFLITVVGCCFLPTQKR